MRRDERRINSGPSMLITVMACIWLIGSPFFLGFWTSEPAAAWNAVIVGGIVLVLDAVRSASLRTASWTGWATAVLGAWLAISPFILGFNNAMAVGDAIIVGIALAVLGTWNALVLGRTVEVSMQGDR